MPSEISRLLSHIPGVHPISGAGTPARRAIVGASDGRPDARYPLSRPPVAGRGRQAGGPATRHAAGDSTPTTSRSEAGPKLAKADAKDDGLIMEPDPAAVAAAAQKGQKSNAPELVQKSTNWVNSFAEDLPNFVCQQSTTRYVQQSKEQGWQAVDVVGAQIVYEDGRESYRSITIGGRPTNKSMLELGGSTSTGEFASTLRSLFSPASQAMFKLYQTTRFADSDATIFDFKVALRNTNWTINTGGQSLRPAYSGSVWIDRYSGEVRRIEMQADNIPGDFPMDSIEWAVEYGRVSLGTATYLLPTHAENLGCQRGSSTCMKNTIDFRNYHKFSGSSTVTFDK